MKIIPLTEAHALLDKASAVIVDLVVTYPSLADLLAKNDAESAANEWLYISWDNDGQEFSVRVPQGPNEEGVKVNGSVMTVIDHEGDEVEITLLTGMQLT